MKAKKLAPMTAEQRSAKTQYERQRIAKKKAQREAALIANEAAHAILPDQIVHSEDYSRADVLAAVAALPEDAPFIEPVTEDEQLPDLNSPEATAAALAAADPTDPVAMLMAAGEAKMAEAEAEANAKIEAKAAKRAKSSAPKEPKAPRATGIGDPDLPSAVPEVSDSMPGMNKTMAALYAEAATGVEPVAPDYGKPVLKRLKKQIAALKDLVERRDVEGLRSLFIKVYFRNLKEGGFWTASGPQELDRYRHRVIIALEAQAKSTEWAQEYVRDAANDAAADRIDGYDRDNLGESPDF